MIKTYWKQLLVTAYIAIVLILSATAKAESFQPVEAADDLSVLQKRIELLYEGQTSEPAVFAQQVFENDNHKPLVMPFEDRGHFVYEEATSKLVFVSEVTNQIFYVRCDNDVRADITSNVIYNVKGFNFSPSSNQVVGVRSPSQQQVNFLSNNNIIFVTGVEIQR